MNRWKNNLTGLTLALAGVVATPAFAQSTTVSQVQGVYTAKVDIGVSQRQVRFLPNGMVRAQRNGGDGNEQMSLDFQGAKGLGVYESNNVATPDGPTGNNNRDAPNGVKCVPITMDPVKGPVLGTPKQLVFSRNSDREGHPTVAMLPDGSGRALVVYGANNVQNDNNTQTYALVVDSQCNDLTATPGSAHPEEQHIDIDNDRNQNIAAARALWVPSAKAFFVGFYRNGADGRTQAALVQVDSAGKIHELAFNDNLIQSNIGRPTLSLVQTESGEKVLVGAPAGRNRPSENGDQVTLLDPSSLSPANNKTGQSMRVVWGGPKTVVQAAPDQNNIGGIDGLPGPLGGHGVYPASPTLAPTDKPNELFLTTFISDGAGRRRNKKGSSTSYAARITVSDSGVKIMSDETGLGQESSHVAACSGDIGTTGATQRVLAFYGAPVDNGSGGATLSMYSYDSTKSAFAHVYDTAVNPTGADGGYLDNMLGRNPNTQGRNHLNCTMVANPGYGVAGGFMPKTKAFIAAPWDGRLFIAGATGATTAAPQVLAANGAMLPEDRNAQFISFVSAVRDADAPAPPAANPATNNGVSSTTTPGSSGTGTAGSAGTYTSGCSYGGSAGDAGAAGLLLVGAFLLLVTRRRWT